MEKDIKRQEAVRNYWLSFIRRFNKFCKNSPNDNAFLKWKESHPSPEDIIKYKKNFN